MASEEEIEQLAIQIEQLTMTSTSSNQVPSNVEQMFFEGKISQPTAHTDDELIQNTIACSKDKRDALKKNDPKGYQKLLEQC